MTSPSHEQWDPRAVWGTSGRYKPISFRTSSSFALASDIEGSNLCQRRGDPMVPER